MDARVTTTDPDDDWDVASPDDVGMKGDLLAGLAPQFEAWTEANLHAALMVRGGRLVFERYFTGDDKAWATSLGRVSYHAGLRHDLRSITKSVTSLLFGIAVDRGLIGDLDARALSFFPEYADLRTAEKDRITLRHLLTMSAGFAWNEYLPYSNPANSERRMIDAPDQYRYVLEQPLARPPGATYNYNGGLTALLAAVLQKRTGRPLEQFAREALFDPLGVAEVEWVRYANGTPNAASSLRMRPRDVARMGQLVLGRGLWRGKRIVSEGWIVESTTAHVNGESLFFYGFQWWLGRSLVARREIKWISAVGYGGQRMFIVPELDLVVVVMAGLYDNPVLQPVVGEVVLRRYALPAALGL